MVLAMIFVKTENPFCHKKCIQRVNLTLKGQNYFSHNSFAKNSMCLNWGCITSTRWMLHAKLEHEISFSLCLRLRNFKKPYIFNQGAAVSTEFSHFIILFTTFAEYSKAMEIFLSVWSRETKGGYNPVQLFS